MPLRDHFRDETHSASSWQGFHGGWPMVIVQHLFRLLPEGYLAEPRVQLGSFFEIDIGTFDIDEGVEQAYDMNFNGQDGTATTLLSPPRPTWSVETEFDDEYEYEVRIYDVKKRKELVAAIELVSPANKDRPKHRQAFISKCIALLHKGVCVSMIDLVTTRQFNLYSELFEQLDCKDPNMGEVPVPTYAATCRRILDRRKSRFDNWYYPMEVGQPLPTIPLWLNDEQVVQFDLEPSYEETCRVLRVR